MSAQASAILSPPAEKRATVLIYLIAFSFVMTIGSNQVLVPLYSLHLGYDIKAVGVILSAQAVMPIFTRFFAGAIADTFGDRWVMLASFLAMVVAATMFAFWGAFWALIAAQTFQGIGRSAYHTVAQSYASRINPDLAATRLGRLGASGNAGTIISTALAGFLAATAGYMIAFGTFAVIGLLGMAMATALPFLPGRASKRSFTAALTPIPKVFATRAMGFAAISAFFGSSAMMLGVALIIPFMRDSGFNETEVGLARTITGVGSLAMGLYFGRVVGRLGLQWTYVVTWALQGGVLIVMPSMMSSFWISLPAMFVYGLLFGIMGTLYPAVASAFSLPEHRGTAMAYSGQFWGLAQLVIPTTFGFIAASVGVASAIRIGGVVLLVTSAIVLIVYPWITKHGAPKREES